MSEAEPLTTVPVPSVVWRRLWVVIILCAGLFSRPAGAQQLTFSSQTEFQLVEERFRDQPNGSFTGFAPTLSISYLSPARPGADLYVDLKLGLAQSVFRLNRQTTDDIRLTLRGEDPRYRVSLRLGRAGFRNAVSAPGLEPARLTSTSQETGLTLLVRDPSYPTLNLQWTRYKAESDFAGVESISTTTTARVAAFYDMLPLRFRYDESRRRTDSPQGESAEALARRAGVTLDAELMPRVNVFGDVQFGSVESRLGGQTTNERADRLMVWRVSALPTPSVVVDAEYFAQVQESPRGRGQETDSDSTGAALRMRSEFLPGIQLNLSREGLRSRRGEIETESATTLADLLSRVDRRNSAALSFAQRQAENNQGLRDSQTNARLSWISQLDSQTDATVSLDRSVNEISATGGSRTSNLNIALRYRPDYKTSIGLAYLTSKSLTERPEGDLQQDLRAVDLDFSWLPSYDLTLAGRVSLSEVRTDTTARFVVPSLDLRWQADSRTDIGVNWRLQSSRLQDAAGGSSFALTLFSGRLRHRLSRFSDFFLTYDIIQSNQGSLELERTLRLVLTTRW